MPPAPITEREQLTAEWLQTVLHHGAWPDELDDGLAVSSVATERIGTGQIGDSIRVTPTYTGNSEGAPASVVVKLPASDPTSREAGIATANYIKEAWWYFELAETVAVQVPRCWFAGVDESGTAVVVLEDLAPAVPGDQIAGCSPDEAASALVQAARLHGPRWNDPTLGAIEWLGQRDPEAAQNTAALYEMVLPGWIDRFGERVGPDAVDVAERFAPRLVDWMLAEGPATTLTHGDFRPDNVMFGGRNGIAVLDWGGINRGPALTDVAYFCGAGLTPDIRRSHEDELLQRYRNELASFGVDLDNHTMWTDYRRQSFAGLVVTVVASMIVRQDDRGDEMFTAMGARHAQHILDVDGFGAL